VANQLATLNNLEKSYELQARQVDTLTQSIEVSNVLFQSARADYMEVLLARRDALDAQTAQSRRPRGGRDALSICLRRSVTNSCSRGFESRQLPVESPHVPR
jgi:hypothetical protein